MMTLILYAALISIGINLIMFFPAYFFKTDKLTDISYALSFVFVSSFYFVTNIYTFEKLVLYLMILVWALRLGLFLFRRIQKMGKDDRFDEMRSIPYKFIGFWLLQGITVFILSIPVVLFLAKDIELTNRNYWIGFTIWLLGLLIESFADSQKNKFRNNTTNKGKWVDIGLWRFIRHPNYTGELLIWFGIFLFISPYLSTMEILISALSPVFIFVLLRYVSGVPLLEQKYNEIYKGNEDYSDYKNRTGRFLPKF